MIVGKQTCFHLEDLGTLIHKQGNKVIFTRTNSISFKPGLDNQPKALSEVPPPTELKSSSPRAKHVPPEREKTLLLPLKAAEQICSSCSISGSASESELFIAFVDKLN